MKGNGHRGSRRLAACAVLIAMMCGGSGGGRESEASTDPPPEEQPVPQAMEGINNPHSNVIFRVTGTSSCRECHRLGDSKGPRLVVREVPAVRDLIAKGKSAHSLGRFADCFRCHAGGRLGLEKYAPEPGLRP